MPHIRCRGMHETQVRELSLTLPGALGPLMKTEESHFTIEKIQSIYFREGQITDGDPFIEVFWFARSKEIQNASADWITQEVRRLTQAEDIQIVFQVYEKSNYYENGNHF